MFARGIVEETSSFHKLKNLPVTTLSISTDVRYNKFPFMRKRDSTCIRVRLTAGLNDHRRAPADKKSMADTAGNFKFLRDKKIAEIILSISVINFDFSTRDTGVCIRLTGGLNDRRAAVDKKSRRSREVSGSAWRRDAYSHPDNNAVSPCLLNTVR